MNKPFAYSMAVLVGLVVLAEVAHWLASGDGPKALGSCAVLVLGYPSNPDGSPHPVQRQRVAAGVVAYRERHCERFVVSGGAVSNPHAEAEAMGTLARDLGVPEAHLVLESRARTTWENVGCAMPHLEGFDRVLIASDALHAQRGRRYACRQQPMHCGAFEAVGAYAPFEALWWKLPVAGYELQVFLRDASKTFDAPPCRADA